MKIKRVLHLFIFFLFFILNLSTYSSLSEAYTPVKVMVNNNMVQWGINPVVINDEVYVSLKEIATALQIESKFDIKTLMAVVKIDENQIELKLDNSTAVLNGKYIQLSGQMKIIENRIMVPVKMFENLGVFITNRDGTILVYRPVDGKITYKVVNGDFLWKISQIFKTSYITIKELNNLTSDTIYINQFLTVKTVDAFQTNFEALTGNATIKSGPGFEYRDVGYLVSGSKVKVVGKNGYWYKVSTYKGDGYIYYTVIKITQNIYDATPLSTYFEKKIPVDTSKNSTSYVNYTVVSGDTLWSISEKKGVPIEELMSINGFSWSTYLRINQIIKVPVHYIAYKQTPGPNYGEILDWFTEGQYVFPITKKGKLTDIETGLSFNVQRTMGSSHSDTETISAYDTKIMKQIFGGVWIWTRRPFILEVDGRRFAVSVSGMPHAGVDGQPFLQNVYNRSGDYGYGQNFDRISGNQMDGHFDLYFLNGLRHKDNQIDPDHQKMVMTAGGLQ